MLDFEELRETAADVRIFIDLAEDKAAALRNIIDAYDVVLGIYPSGDEMGIYVIKGREIIERAGKSNDSAAYAHTAIAVPDRHHAAILKELTAQRPVQKLAA